MDTKEYFPNKDGLNGLLMDVETLACQTKANVIIGCESTGIYHLPLVEFFDKKKLDLKVFNGLELRKYHGSKIRKTRNDPIDADTIARALVIENIIPDNAKIPKDVKNLRELTRIKGRIVEYIGRCKVRIKRDMDIIARGYSRCFKNILGRSSTTILKSCVQLTKPFDRSEEDIFKMLKKVRYSKAKEKAREIKAIFENSVRPEGVFEACVIEIRCLIQQYELMTEQVEKIDKRIERLVEKMGTPILSINGIGKTGAGIILGEIGSVDRFKTVDSLVAYAGLDPSVKKSGQYESSNRKISKRGSPYLRRALYNSAVVAMTRNPVCKAFAQRLKAKGKKPRVVIVAVARKLLTIVYSVLKNNRKFYVPKGLQNTTG
jgi:transposase